MRVAIDKTLIKKIKDKTKFDYTYIFNEDEKLDDLIKLNMKCVNYKYCDGVEVNLTEYDIPCLKKCTFKDNWQEEVKKEYKFAIIVPNCNNDRGSYNGKSYLRNCIESILNQTYKKFELILVDDMSEDTSLQTMREYEKDKRVHIIQNKTKRYNGGSRNAGIEYVKNNLDVNYICFLDSDDWWIDENVLQKINDNLFDHELMLIGLQCIDNKGVFLTKLNEYSDYKDFFLSDNKTWCTAWCRVIRADKIVYFCENTLMEDRVWSYRQADNVDLRKVKNLKEVLYVWNRMNTENSVSLVRGERWEASAWTHIGHQKMLLTELKHKEMIPILENRIKECERRLGRREFVQY